MDAAPLTQRASNPLTKKQPSASLCWLSEAALYHIATGAIPNCIFVSTTVMYAPSGLE